ncbi:hypothetical protein SAMN04487996_101274 [Dyadobacter soli]|uniref:Uncharacterized protein n=1 Tax=Dyadobacter soli TaxID=659014 RepID=A0A1G6VLC4_9BACT|nr:hypothetical protein SAMN04487996_101274 [Dyadobacter soli]
MPGIRNLYLALAPYALGQCAAGSEANSKEIVRRFLAAVRSLRIPEDVGASNYS